MASRSLALAIAAAGLTLAQSGFVDECTGLKVEQTYLFGSCLTGTDASSRIDSTVFLGSKITNRDGHLEWTAGSNGGYSSSCSQCSLEQAVLTCECQKGSDGRLWTSINLEERVSNYDGHLLSNVTGSVNIPEGNSPIPVANDFSWRLLPGDTSQWPSNTPPVANPGPCDGGGYTASGNSPTCITFRWPVSGEIYNAFQGMNPIAAENAWTFTIYDQPLCAGAPIVEIAPEEANTCHTFSKKGLSVSIQPAWNSD
ncbi:Cyanovirin-N [Stachybotrys elegans]|uniref:Cyanovirin-N n=1 Tax=Stachybotrys elegans TaxID=80388 RepID=A0A8K0WKE3_9HYPO|nr:Cyanovirin-N [Stachybotrys elegans]